MNMKLKLRVLAAVVGCLMMTATAPAQSASTKIAVIQSYRFTDEKTGIMKFVAAFKQVDKEFEAVAKELDAMRTKYDGLVREITDLQAKVAKGTVPVDPKSIETKALEASQLDREIKFKAEDAKAKFERRQQEVLKPIQLDIGKAIGEYAKQKGFALIFDASKDEVGLLIAIGDEKVDVTTDFIAFYNARPANTPAKP